MRDYKTIAQTLVDTCYGSKKTISIDEYLTDNGFEMTEAEVMALDSVIDEYINKHPRVLEEVSCYLDPDCGWCGHEENVPLDCMVENADGMLYYRENGAYEWFADFCDGIEGKRELAADEYYEMQREYSRERLAAYD